VLTRIFRRHKVNSFRLLNSQLFDQMTFYTAFVTDLGRCQVANIAKVKGARRENTY
jgi:hypothetical protein